MHYLVKYYREFRKSGGWRMGIDGVTVLIIYLSALWVSLRAG
jgi:hypothetical protein